MPEIINVTDIVEYLYCPRKIFLRKVKKLKFPPNKKMILGFLRHKVFDIFNKNEAALVSSIIENINEEQIKEKYQILLSETIEKILTLHQNLASSFRIDENEFSSSINKTMFPEIRLRVKAVRKALDSGFLGKELWHNLKPKYLTEFQIESPELGLRGRIDRIKFEQGPVPYEIKTRKDIFESDKIQLAAYSLLLENEFKSKIEKGIIEFLGREEEIFLTEELKNRVFEIAEKIRNMTQQEATMPSNFNKCKKCQYKNQCI